MTAPLYLVSTGSTLHGAHDRIGVMIGPRVRSLTPIHEGRPWAADCDGYTWRATPDTYLPHLQRLAPYRDTCLFAVVPDCRPDADSTLAAYPHWAALLAPLGFPLAYCAHDGSEQHELPECDVVFIAGTDAWRQQHAATVARRALSEGRRVHVGRVNSARRLHGSLQLGASSVDGTYLAYRGVEWGVRDITRWLDTTQPTLWSAA